MSLVIRVRDGLRTGWLCMLGLESIERRPRVEREERVLVSCNSTKRGRRYRNIDRIGD